MPYCRSPALPLQMQHTPDLIRTVGSRRPLCPPTSLGSSELQRVRACRSVCQRAHAWIPSQHLHHPGDHEHAFPVRSECQPWGARPISKFVLPWVLSHSPRLPLRSLFIASLQHSLTLLILNFLISVTVRFQYPGWNQLAEQRKVWKS